MFSYIISDKLGREQTGVLEVETVEEAANQIKQDGWFIVRLEETGAWRRAFPFIKRKPSLSAFERIVFTDHLAAMIKSGTPLVEALETYQEEGTRSFRIIESLLKDIQQGKKLSEAMSIYPSSFPPLYLALIKAGELTGSLDETLEALGNDLRREHEFYERIKSAMLYPLLVLFVAMIVIIMLVLFVIPRITLLTQSFGGDLPIVTKIVSKVASFLTVFGPLIIGLVFFSLIVLVFALRQRKIREYLGPYLLRIPLIGKLLRKFIYARFLRTLGGCLWHGVPLTESFTVVSDVVNNRLYKEAFLRIEDRVSKGVSLAQSFSDEGLLFPKILIRTVKGAEKTGTLHEAMLRLSGFFEAEVDRDLKRITDLIEPALVIVLGIIVGAIAISVIAPIYQLTSRIK